MEKKTSHDSEKPAEGQQVITACAFIHRRVDGVDEIFLGKRADTKKFLPGLYELPGGHIEYGEEVVPGLKREVKEEFNMNITVGDPFFVYDYVNKIKGAHAIEVVYFATFLGPLENIRLNPADHSRYDWISEGNITNLGRQISAANETTNSMLGGIGEIDPEVEAMRRGFEILRGGRHNVA